MISGNLSHGILVKKRGEPNTEIKHPGLPKKDENSETTGQNSLISYINDFPSISIN